MEELFRSWLYSLLVSGCICSLILFLNPDSKGKHLLETGCACAMLFSFLSPLPNFPTTNEILPNFSEWTSIEMNESFSDQSSAIQKFMESEYRAYILTEADKEGITLIDVSVYSVLDENDNWIPESIEYISEVPIPESFKLRIAKDLGITEEGKRK